MPGEFSNNTIRVLAKRAGERCSICGESTSKPTSGDPGSFLNLGEAAHIRGIGKGRHTRYDSTMTMEARSNITNAIWLCNSCHKEVDSDSSKYTVISLDEIKKKHENRIQLREFDVNWKEYESLKKQVAYLEALIYEKEENNILQGSHSTRELNEIRMQIEKTTVEKNNFEVAIKTLTNTIAGFEIQNPSPETKLIIEAYRKGEILKVKEALNEALLKNQEAEIARKRLLHANIAEIEKKYSLAQSSYLKSYLLSPTKEYFEYYVAFLKRIGKYSIAKELCLEKLKEEIDTLFRIWIHSALGDLFTCLQLSQQALTSFQTAKALIIQELLQNPESGTLKLDKAKISSAIGIAHKNVGDFDPALKEFEESLNDFWNMTIYDGITHGKELGTLYNSIGLLYSQNLNNEEGVKYLLMAKAAFEEKAFKDDFLLATVYLNLVDIYSYRTTENNEARKFIELAMSLISKGFNTRPLLYLEYHIGVYVKSGDNYFHSGNFDNSEKNYLEAIELGERFRTDYEIWHRSIMGIAYFNYAVFLKFRERHKEAISFIDKGLLIFSTFDNSEQEKHFNLAKLTLFKADIVNDKNLQRRLVYDAYDQIKLCKEHPVIRTWKKMIEDSLQRLKASE